MPLINRASLPTEFFDITSDSLLVQPEPQYMFAQLWKLALGAALGSPGALGRGAVGENGAPVPDVDAMRLMLDDGLAASTIKVVPELGKSPGHTVKINRPFFEDTTYTAASREVASGSTISTSPIDISNEQVALTIKRFVGPYDQANARPAPYGLDRFDASMSVHKLAGLVGHHLKRDFDKFVDSSLISLLDSASTIVRPGALASDDAILDAGAAPCDLATIAATERALDDANIPVFPNGRRILVLTPRQIESLKLDSDFARLAESHAPWNPILAQSYYKSIGGFDVYKSNSLRKVANTSSVPVQRGVAFGPGVLGSGVGEMPRVAFANEDNFGESALVVWILYAAFSLLDNRFAVSVRTS
jgi:hypothetical protein